MQYTTGIAAVIAAATATAASAATADDFQVWSSLSLSVALTNRIMGGLELSGRFSDDSSRLGTTIVRPTIGYRIDDNVTVHIGYVRQVALNIGTPNQKENRFFQQANWRIGKLGKVTVNSRTRIEYRTFENARDAGWRVRERIQFVVPVENRNTNFVMSSEQAFALNSTDWGASAGFDQMRNFIGVQLPISNAIVLETGFQHRYQRRVGQPDRSDFVLPIIVSAKL